MTSIGSALENPCCNELLGPKGHDRQSMGGLQSDDSSIPPAISFRAASEIRRTLGHRPSRLPEVTHGRCHAGLDRWDTTLQSER